MAISGSHVVMGRMIAASGSLAGEMKVAAISGSTGLTLNQMLIKLDDNATADVTALIGGATSTHNTLKKLEDIMILIQQDVDQNESDSDSAESALDVRLDVIEHASGVGSIAKAQADAQAFATSADSALSASALTSRNQKLVEAKAYTDAIVDGAPGALNTLNELAAALGDDANYAATITTALGTKAVGSHLDAVEAALGTSIVNASGVYQAFSSTNYIDGLASLGVSIVALDTQLKATQDDVDSNESVADAVIGVGGDSNLGTFTGGIIADTQTVKVALQSVESKIEADNIILDAGGGFNVSSSATAWNLGWGINKPLVSFEINPDASVTMSVIKRLS
tara:strand:- start:31 stop:1047 length:1017 start_codon:yes stop_codon:yes gene_type:complete